MSLEKREATYGASERDSADDEKRNDDAQMRGSTHDNPSP